MWEFIWRWETLWWLMLILYVPSCAGLIVIVLLQKGKGTGFAGAFGIGPGSDTVFGPRASQSLPVRLTHVMAAVFMILALAMSLVSGRLGKGIAPDKVEEADVLGEMGVLGESLDDMLDDLGTAVEGSEAVPGEKAVPPPPEGAAEQAGEVTVTVPPEVPPTEGAAPGETTEPPGTVTVTVAPEPVPAEQQPTPAEQPEDSAGGA